MRTSPIRSATVAALAAAVLTGCASAAPVVDRPATGADSPAPTAHTWSPAPTASPPSADTGATASLAAGREYADRPAPDGVAPVRVRIPAIDLDAPVEDMGLTDDGGIEVPTDFDDTGWWSYSPQPGRVGASAILGHVDSTTGPAVFFRLHELQPGDEIHVDGGDGDTVTFVVRRLEQYPKDDFPSQAVLGATTTPTLRLITCGGAFDSNAGSYLDNVVAFAELQPPA